MRALSFTEFLPEGVKLDATLCFNELLDVAEREIEKAYWDGFKQHQLQTRLPRFEASPASSNSRS